MNRMRLFYGLIFLLTPLLTTAQTDFNLTGNILKPDISGKAYLYYKNGRKDIRDSVVMVNGNFIMSGKLMEPVKALLQLKYNEPGKKMKVERRELYLDNEQFSIIVKGDLKDADILNSTINSKWQSYKVAEAASRVELNNVIAEIKNSAESKEKDTALISIRKLKLNEANNSLDIILEDYIIQNSDSYFSFLALDQIAGPYFEAEKIELLFKKLSPRLQNSLKGVMLKSSIALALATSVGKKAPDFTLKNTEDAKTSLSQYKGQYVLIDFWASWCMPCRAENPNLILTYNKYKSKNFKILGLSVDRKQDRDKWLKAIEVDKLPWLQIIDEAPENSIADLYSIKSIPANFLINPEGIIIAKNLRAEKLEAMLETILLN